MALSDFIGGLLKPIIDRIKAALGPFGKLFDLIGEFFTGFKDSFTKGVDLAQLIMSELSAWKNFKEEVHYRTGVINLPKAIEKSKELFDQVIAAWHAIIDLAKQLQKQVEGQVENPTEEAEAAVKDIESSGVKSFLEQFPKLAKGLEKVIGFLAIAVGALESIQSAIDDLTEIVEAIKGLREEVETGSTIFLQQKNARRNLKLEEGGNIKIRVGNLHG